MLTGRTHTGVVPNETRRGMSVATGCSDEGATVGLDEPDVNIMQSFLGKLVDRRLQVFVYVGRKVCAI